MFEKVFFHEFLSTQHKVSKQHTNSIPSSKVVNYTHIEPQITNYSHVEQQNQDGDYTYNPNLNLFYVNNTPSDPVPSNIVLFIQRNNNSTTNHNNDRYNNSENKPSNIHTVNKPPSLGNNNMMAFQEPICNIKLLIQVDHNDKLMSKDEIYGIIRGGMHISEDSIMSVFI